VELRPGLHRIETEFEGVPLALYLLRGEDGFTLVDSGCAFMVGPVIERYLAGLGAKLADVRLVVNTHEHFDHAGGNAALARAGAEIAASEAAVPWIEDHERAVREYHLFPEIMGYTREYLDKMAAWMGEEAPVTRVLRPGDVLLAGDYNLEVYAAPGHSAGGIFLHERQAGLLLTGDALQGEGLRLANGAALAPEYRDLAAYRSTLALAASLEAQMLLPSHFPPQDIERARRFLADCAAATERLGRQVAAILALGERSLRGASERAASALGYEFGLELVTSVWQHAREAGIELA